MTMPSDNKGHGLASNLWAQVSLLIVVALVVVVLAARQALNLTAVARLGRSAKSAYFAGSFGAG